ncbi:MAG: hypothetical protein WBX38_08905 [Candidatus Sulfotelmatobacter sp.]
MNFQNVPRCQHVKVNGVQCGSPALRRKPRCYFHERVQYERDLAAESKSGHRNFGFPLLEDANSIQVALMKVIQMLGSGILDHKTGALMLYGLQTASANLRHAKFEPEKLTDVVIDEDTVDLTRVQGPQWCARDFDDSQKEASPLAEPAVQPDVTTKKTAPAPALNEEIADYARRRELKRKLPDRPEEDGEGSLAELLLKRMGLPTEERDTAEETENG